jgi:hypothetical protein
MAGHESKLRGVLDLFSDIPSELINVPPADYADLVVAKGTMEQTMATWVSRGPAGNMPGVGATDAISVLHRVLKKCRDEPDTSAVSRFSFIADVPLRESIGQDYMAVHRAMSNSEWKSATVLAGATIEALLRWKISQQASATVDAAAAAAGIASKTFANLDHWNLYEYIMTAQQLGLIRLDTAKASLLAKDFRNLIHPGRANRLGQTCNLGTAHTAVGALEHVIEDIK